MNLATRTIAPLGIRHRALDAVALAFLLAQLVFAIWIVPEWSLAHLIQPVYMATVTNVAVTLLIVAIRFRAKGSERERLLLALFLAGMPLIYVSSWLRSPQQGRLPIELVGVVIFGALAYLGLRRSPWFLVGGILAHGLGWDLAHHGHTTFIPDWYAIGCLVADVGVGVYAAAQISAWNARRSERDARRTFGERYLP